MDSENNNLDNIQQKINNQLENQKKLYEEEQNKAKALFDHLRQESINSFEQARHNIQRHIEEVNSFGKNLQSHFQSQPFDFTSFSKVVADYQTKQLEILSQATQKQTEKLTELQHKLSNFYQDKQTVVKSEMEKNIDNTVQTTKEVVEKIIKPKTVSAKSAPKNTEKTPVNKAKSVKSTVATQKTSSSSTAKQKK